MADNNDDVGSDGLVNLTEQHIARTKGSAQVADNNNDDVRTDSLMNRTKQYISHTKKTVQESMEMVKLNIHPANPTTLMSYGALGTAAALGSIFLMRRVVRNTSNSLGHWWVRRQQNPEATENGTIISSQQTPFESWSPDFEWVPSITKYVMQERPDDTINKVKKYEMVQAMRKYVMEQRRKSEGRSPDGDAAGRMENERSQF